MAHELGNKQQLPPARPCEQGFPVQPVSSGPRELPDRIGSEATWGARAAGACCLVGTGTDGSGYPRGAGHLSILCPRISDSGVNVPRV